MYAQCTWVLEQWSFHAEYYTVPSAEIYLLISYTKHGKNI